MPFLSVTVESMDHERSPRSPLSGIGVVDMTEYRVLPVLERYEKLKAGVWMTKLCLVLLVFTQLG
jgi:hypothetical protein